MTAKKRHEIIEKAMLEATKKLGVDPAYYGEEGEKEVDQQLEKMGYDPVEFKRKKPND